MTTQSITTRACNRPHCGGTLRYDHYEGYHVCILCGRSPDAPTPIDDGIVDVVRYTNGHRVVTSRKRMVGGHGTR